MSQPKDVGAKKPQTGLDPVELPEKKGDGWLFSTLVRPPRRRFGSA